MKLLLIILLALFGNTILYPQVEEEELHPDNEFTIQIQNAVNRTIVFEMVPIGANWAKIEFTTCDILLKNDDETYISSLYGAWVTLIVPIIDLNTDFSMKAIIQILMAGVHNLRLG